MISSIDIPFSEWRLLQKIHYQWFWHINYKWQINTACMIRNAFCSLEILEIWLLTMGHAWIQIFSRCKFTEASEMKANISGEGPAIIVLLPAPIFNVLSNIRKLFLVQDCEKLMNHWWLSWDVLCAYVHICERTANRFCRAALIMSTDATLAISMEQNAFVDYSFATSFGMVPQRIL